MPADRITYGKIMDRKWKLKIDNYMKKIFLTAALFCAAANAGAQTWIWYPGDFEIWLGNELNNRRTDRGTFFPPFWKQDSHYVTVEFSKKVSLAAPETIVIKAEGKYNVKIDGKMLFGMPREVTLQPGNHSVNIKVWNQNTPPAIFVDGKTIKSDSSWKVTNEDKEWIDESGKASDTSASIYMDAGSWNFNNPSALPSHFMLDTEEMPLTKTGDNIYDAGRESFGFITLSGISGNGTIDIYYGESKEEAADKDKCETLDKLEVKDGTVTNLSTLETGQAEKYTLPLAKAFRYVQVCPSNGVNINKVSALNEFLPSLKDILSINAQASKNSSKASSKTASKASSKASSNTNADATTGTPVRGSFRCNDEEMNKIWEMGEYTLALTTREFFIDGIKRDRWTWSGDAYQSYLMNYYSFYDSECVKRTTWQLRGKDPVTSHINTIMDYTFYWFLGIYDYYMYTGDRHFVEQIYPRMQTLMDYVLSRTDDNGMVQGLSGDWVFVDWADGPMSKKGELAFEQVLFCKSLETMKLCADITGNADDAAKYGKLSETLKAKLLPTFWDESRKALVHNVENGKQSSQITRYANMFAIFFDYLSPEQKQQVKDNVIYNDKIMKITTPYMRFYELEALCAIGDQNDVYKQMKDYWGGMIREGATSFWEKYNPEESGTQHLAMYGRPYGKSLCHAWGASPIYLLGKYYLGVKPVKPGYEEFSITPVLGGMKWMEGTVPTPQGSIYVYADSKKIRVKADGGKGYVYLKKGPKNVKAEKTADNHYRVEITSGKETEIKL